MSKKISLVVGGSKGIGSVISKCLKSRGDDVYILSRNNSNKNSFIKGDLFDERSLKISLEKRFKNKKIDNLVFSQRYRGDSWVDEFKVSLFSVESIIKFLKKKFNKNASIVIISSVANKTILHDQSSQYHITRGALEHLVRYYAVSFGKSKIRFNCVMPTKIIKPENKNFFNRSPKGIKIKKLIKKITPLNEMGTAKDIGYLVEFLTSFKSQFITGQSFVVDGGASLLSQESIINIIKK